MEVVTTLGIGSTTTLADGRDYQQGGARALVQLRLDGGAPTLFRDHTDLPPEQFGNGVALDSFTTGLALSIWFVEAPATPTTLVRLALETYYGRQDLPKAVRMEGTSNLSNNAGLIGLIQNFL